MSTDDLKRKRGHPPRAYAEKLRAKTVCEMAIARSGGRSVSWLDVEFARGADGKKRKPEDRRQVFEHAKNRGKPLPTDVINRLEEDPAMRGIKHVEESIFFPLLLNPPRTRRAVQQMVDKCLDKLKLVRLSPGLEEIWISRKWRAGKEADENIQWRDEGEIARERIEILAKENPKNLDLIALLGALYREACLTFEPEAATYLGIRFWMLLEDFLARPEFDAVSRELQDYAVNRIIFDRDDTEAQHGFRLFSKDRLPGSAIGLLLPTDDPDLLEVKRTNKQQG